MKTVASNKSQTFRYGTFAEATLDIQHTSSAVFAPRVRNPYFLSVWHQFHPFIYPSQPLTGTTAGFDQHLWCSCLCSACLRLLELPPGLCLQRLKDPGVGAAGFLWDPLSLPSRLPWSLIILHSAPVSNKASLPPRAPRCWERCWVLTWITSLFVPLFTQHLCDRTSVM